VDGEYTVEVCVTDDNKGTGCDTLTVTVNNVLVTAPATTGAGEVTYEIDSCTVESFQAIDEASLPGNGKPNVAFDWGLFSIHLITCEPGASVLITIQLPSPLPVGGQFWKEVNGSWIQLPIGSDDGDNIITITLTDGGLGDGDGIINGEISDPGGPAINQPPVTDAGSYAAIDEGGSIALDGSASWDADGISLYEWDCTNNGVYNFSSTSPTGNSCSYADNGSITLSLQASDSFGNSSTDSATVTVNNVAPIVSAGPDQGAYEGNLFTLTTPTFTDPGVLDTHTATIDWGDGTVTDPADLSEFSSPNTVSGSHIYGAEGDYTATVCVTDNDGGQDCDSLQVGVNPVIRLRGFIYNGPKGVTTASPEVITQRLHQCLDTLGTTCLLGDTSQPLPDVTLHLFGRNEGEDSPGTLISSKESQLSGYFNFYILEPWFYDIFTLMAQTPQGMMPIGIWSEAEAEVIDSQTIQWRTAVLQENQNVHENLFFFETSTVSPTEVMTETITLPLLADTWVTWGESNDNYDNYASLVIRPTGQDNALLKFGRSALPQGVTILNATLTVNVSGQTGAAGKQLTVLNSDVYTPKLVTYDNAPAAYNPGAGVDVPTTPGPLSFDVASQVAAWDAPGLVSYQWGYLALSATGPAGRISLDSLESSPGAPATLTVTYTTP